MESTVKQCVELTEAVLTEAKLREEFHTHLLQSPQQIFDILSRFLHSKREQLKAETESAEELSFETTREFLKLCDEVICGGRTDTEECFKEWKQQGILKSNVCGYVWKDGDDAYKCSNCEMDSSCAICAECFNAGNHTNHNYKMVKVSGGVCDCGDFQAWKRSGFCSKHGGVKESDEQQTLLPPEVLNRTSQIIRALLVHLNHLLRMLQELDNDQIDTIEEDTIALLVYLEAFATKGDAFRVLLAHEWTKEIPPPAEKTEGTETEDSMSISTKRKAESLESLETSDAKKLKTNHEKSKETEKLPTPNNTVSALSSATSKYSLLHDVTQLQVFASEQVMQQLHTVFLLLLYVPSFRKKFLTDHFIPYYRDHVEQHIKLGAPISDMIADFPVQLFTVASCVDTLKEHKVLQMLIEKTYNVLRSTILESLNEEPPADKILTIIPEHDTIVHRFYSRLLVDMNYILSHKEMANYFLFHNDSELVVNWCSVLQMIQGMDKGSNIRVDESQPHAEFDTETWICGFMLDFEVMILVPLILDGITRREKDKERDNMDIEADVKEVKLSQLANIWPAKYQHLITKVLSALEAWLLQEFEVKSISDVPTNLKNISADDKGVSFHFPLHRLLSALLCEGARLFGCSLTELLPHPSPRNLLLKVVEHPLRIQALLAQVRVGMWSRNGREVWAQSTAYESIYFRDTFKDYDLFLLQCCCVVLGHEEFAKLSLERFEISHLLTNTLDTKWTDTEKRLLEDYLRFLVVIASDRTKAGLSETALLRREVIHRLCIGDMTHSALSGAISQDAADSPLFKKILKQVATFILPQQMEQGSYRLKDECWSEFDRYFIHYTREEAQTAEERYHSHAKNATPNLKHRQLPTYPALAGLKYLLHNATVYKLLFKILYMTCTDTALTSDAVVTEALHMIQMSLFLYAHKDSKPAVTPRSKEIQDDKKESNTIFTGDINQFEFPSDLDIIENARYEVKVSGEKKESIISLIRKLLEIQQLSHHHEKVNQLLSMFAEHDLLCKQYIEELESSHKKEHALTENEEEEKRKQRRLRQQEIMKQFSQKMTQFKMDDVDLEENDEDLLAEEAENKRVNPFPAEVTTCALCHENVTAKSMGTKPVGLVSYIQPTKVIQQCRELQTRQPTSSLDASTDSLSPRKKNADEDSESEDEGSDIDLSDSEDDSDSDEDYEDNIADKDFDRVAQAHKYLISLMQDPDIAVLQDQQYPMDQIAIELPQHDYFYLNEDDEDEEDEDEEDEEGADIEDVIADALGGEEDTDADEEGEPADMSEDEAEEGEEGEGAEEEGAEQAQQPAASSEGTDVPAPEPDASSAPSAEGSAEAPAAPAPNVPMNWQGMVQQANKEIINSGIKAYEKDMKSIEKRIEQLETGKVTQEAIQVCEALQQEIEELNNDCKEMSAAYSSHLNPELSKRLQEVVDKLQTLNVRCMKLIQAAKQNWSFLDLENGTHLSMQLCNVHTLHFDCLTRYLNSLLESHRRGEPVEGENFVDVHRGEFLCVVCRRLSSFLIPVLPFHLVIDVPTRGAEKPMPLAKWLTTFGDTLTAKYSAANTITLTPEMLQAIEYFTETLKKNRYTQTVLDSLAKQTSETEDAITPTDLLTSETVWSATGATLCTLEIYLRGKASQPHGSSVLNCDNIQRVSLRSQFLATMCERYSKAESTSLHQHQMRLCKLITGIEVKSVNVNNTTSALELPLLSQDIFSVLVQLIFIWPKPSSIISDFMFLVELMYEVLITQLVAHFYLDHHRQKYSKLEPTAGVEFEKYVKSFIDNGFKLPSESIDTALTPACITYLKNLSLQFLRRSALFLNLCLAVQPIVSQKDQEEEEEHTVLSKFLQLQSLESVVKELFTTNQERMKGWLISLLAYKKEAMQEFIFPDLVECIPFKLITLPPLYHDLLQQYANAKCKNCKTVPNTKALCLVCGALLCAGNSCCRTKDSLLRGELTQSCGAGVGMFLLMKLSLVMVMRGTRHSFWGSPYLDEHGEEDKNLVRGKALYFNKERYEQLTQLYLSHRIEYDSRIAESTEIEDSDWY